RRTWPDGAGLADGASEVQPQGSKKATISSLGWDDALVSYRPFLSYNELGSMLDEQPSKLHDALALVLGLDELTVAEKTLRDARPAPEGVGRKRSPSVTPSSPSSRRSATSAPGDASPRFAE